MASDFGLVRILSTSYANALELVPAALKTEGFGVLTRIDVKATLKEKLNVDVSAYTILGACNPKMAHQALTIDPTIGVNLPCNVVVRDLGGGQIEVRAVDPVQTIGAGGREQLAGLASQVRDMLVKALSTL